MQDNFASLVSIAARQQKFGCLLPPDRHPPLSLSACTKFSASPRPLASRLLTGGTRNTIRGIEPKIHARALAVSNRPHVDDFSRTTHAAATFYPRYTTRPRQYPGVAGIQGVPTKTKLLRGLHGGSLPPDFDGLVVRGSYQHFSGRVVVDVADHGAVALEPLHDSAARCLRAGGKTERGRVRRK